MRWKLVAAAAAVAVSVGIGPAMANADEHERCNWGRLTAQSIRGGFPQGAHASDPSGDGHGPGTNDEPRDGLANVVERGNLNATCAAISGA